MKYIILAISLIILNCSSSTSNKSKYDPPADHTVSKDGAKHKPGLNDPLSNCIDCHGSDLRGGDTGVSCYECHGEKW